MRLLPHIARFRAREEGSLLVFFMVSALTILGIVALSFDLGRRAATQTDMQAFVDNVALAAAGELDGSPNAIVNATQAATSVINAANESLKAGTAGQDFTIALDQIVFYEDLPATDAPTTFDPDQLSNPASINYKYRLPTSDLGTSPDPVLARYVGVRLATVDVPWIFAGVFSASDLPDQAIGAIAVAGNSDWVCDVAPIAFCLPREVGGVPQQLAPGRAINLRAARQDARWRTGEFGFIDVGVDPSGSCAGLTDLAGRQACLITARTRFASCFQPRRSDVQPGQRPAQESSAFDMSFDIFDQSMIQFFNEALYAPGPHSVRGRVPDSSGDICVPGDLSPDTMTFPLDDCHATASCVDRRFGDGNWSLGRDTYVETNYTLHERPYDPASDPSTRSVALAGSFFDFPETGLSRYDFYLREIERAANGGEMSARYAGAVYAPDNDGAGEVPPDDPTVPGPFYSTWDDYWPDSPAGTSFNPIIPDAHGRFDNGLPRCNTNDTLPPDPERRVLLAVGIDCSGSSVVGFDENVEVIDFYRLFQLGPTENVSGLPERFDLNVEVVERLEIPATRKLVQLYR
ncbi:MAG: hypothetical protein AAFR73_10540 [Pseudomonadota bacterium]